MKIEPCPLERNEEKINELLLKWRSLLYPRVAPEYGGLQRNVHPVHRYRRRHLSSPDGGHYLIVNFISHFSFCDSGLIMLPDNFKINQFLGYLKPESQTVQDLKSSVLHEEVKVNASEMILIECGSR